MLRREDEYSRKDAAGYKTLNDQNLSHFYWYSRSYCSYNRKYDREDDFNRPFKVKENDFKYIAKTLLIFISFLTFFSAILSYQANSLFHPSKSFSKFSVQKVISIDNR